jgi:hypothetical protein
MSTRKFVSAAVVAVGLSLFSTIAAKAQSPLGLMFGQEAYTLAYFAELYSLNGYNSDGNYDGYADAYMAYQYTGIALAHDAGVYFLFAYEDLSYASITWNNFYISTGDPNAYAAYVYCELAASYCWDAYVNY